MASYEPFKRAGSEVGDPSTPDSGVTDTYRSIFDNTHTVMLLIDPTTGEIVDANKAASDFYGYSREELVIRRITDLNALPESEIRARMISATEREAKLFEFSHRLASGEFRDVEVHSGPITVNGRNLLFSIIHDISARKTAETALRVAHDELESRVAERTASLLESEEKYRSLFEHTLDGVILTTPEGEILSANPAASRIFGMTQEEFCERGRDGLLDGDDPRVKVFMEERAATGKASGEITAIHNDGTRFPLEATSAVYLDSKGNERACVIIRDVRERRELEECLIQAQKMEALGLLASSIAHDFNNILAAITVYAQLIVGRAVNDKTLQSYALQVTNAAERGVSVTKELLTFSRRSDNGDALVSANTIVENMATMLRTILPQRINLTTTICSDTPSFRGNAAKIEQALMNLVINASDAMPSGGNVHVATAIEDRSAGGLSDGVPVGNFATITVSDHGQGINEDIKHRMFAPFFTTKEHKKGTGLGLYIVAGIVKQHRGHITVASHPGKGSIFTLYFPAVVHDQEHDASSTSALRLWGTPAG